MTPDWKILGVRPVLDSVSFVPGFLVKTTAAQGVFGESCRHAGRAGHSPRRPHSPPARPAISGLRCSCVDELPSVALTRGSCPRASTTTRNIWWVKLVGVGRGTGVPGLPESDDWTTWDAGQMRAAVEYWSTCASDKARLRQLRPAQVSMGLRAERRRALRSPD